MSEEDKTTQRIKFFEELHQQFLHIKGYGTYAYISANEVDQLYDSYLEQQKAVLPSADLNFIKTFVKSI